MKRRKQAMAVAGSGKRSGRTRRIPWRVVGFVLLGVWLLGMALAGQRISRLFSESPSFRLAALEVRGLRLLRGPEILAASGLQVGDSIFEIDLALVGDRLADMPWVKEALVVRKPPDRLVVSIVERRRLAWIDVGEVYAVDREAVLLPARRRATESYRDLDLPIVKGVAVSRDSLRVGEAVHDSVLVELLGWWQQANAWDAEFCMNVSEVRPLEDGGVCLYLVGDGLEVRLPVDRVGERLTVLKQLMGRVYRECPEPSYVDLRFARQAVVGTRAAASRS